MAESASASESSGACESVKRVARGLRSLESSTKEKIGAKEKEVQSLLDLLDDCATLVVEKEGDVSDVVELVVTAFFDLDDDEDEDESEDENLVQLQERLSRDDEDDEVGLPSNALLSFAPLLSSALLCSALLLRVLLRAPSPPSRLTAPRSRCVASRPRVALRAVGCLVEL